MLVFWQTIADYNRGTIFFQAIFVILATVLTFALYHKPSKITRNAMRIFMATVNFWIAGVYYMIYCQPREYHGMMAFFWTIMGCLWIYDIFDKQTSLENTGRHHKFAIVMLVMPLIYPVASFILGRAWPFITTPLMPCSVAVFTVGLMMAFSKRINMILAMLLCHWALVGLSKVYFFGIPEDYIMGCTIIPALYIFFREYINSLDKENSKPSIHVLNSLLLTLCLIIAALYAITLIRQFQLFSAT